MFILVLSSFIIGYYSLKYKVSIDDVFIINTINEFAQAKAIISGKDVLIIGLFIILLSYGLLKIKIKKSAFKFKLSFISIASLMIIFIVATIAFKYSYIAEFNKYRGLDQGIRQEIAHNISYYKYFYTIRGVIRYYNNTPSNTEIIASIKQGDVYLKKSNNITTLFVMSDSVRAKSMSLLGYNINTNPNLQRLYDNKQIYTFKQNSCYTGTFVSLNCMLSLKKAEIFKTVKSYNYAKEKITKYFNYLGVDTYYLYNNEVNCFHSGFKYVSYKTETPRLDKEVLPKLYENINNQAQFITVNLRGAHIPYDLMLENRFKQFKPKSNDKIDIAYSNYHNKVLQTDYIWSDIISFLSKQDTPVFAIFTADHGQSLGEYHNGEQYFIHGAEGRNIQEQQEVPLIVYINEAYKKLYPSYAKNIENNMKKYRNSLVQSDIISHSLLHCSAIEGQVVDKSLSLCSNLNT